MKLIYPLLALALFCTISSSQAQPDVNNAPKGDNPQNRRAVDVLRRREQAQEERVRTQLKKLGVVGVKEQETVLKFVQEETEAQQDITAKGLKLNQAFRNDALTTAQITLALNDYQAVLEDNKIRHDKALAALKKQIDFTQNPRLETWLTLAGLVGDGPLIVPATAAKGRTIRVNGMIVDGLPAAPAAPPAP